MFSSTTEAVTHLSYGSQPPSVFALTDDLFDPRVDDYLLLKKKGTL